MMSSQERRSRERERGGKREGGKEGRKEGERAALLPVETAEPRAGRSHLRRGRGWIVQPRQEDIMGRHGNRQVMHVAYEEQSIQSFSIGTQGRWHTQAAETARVRL